MPLTDYPHLEQAHIHLRHAARLLDKETGQANTGDSEEAMVEAHEKAMEAIDWIEQAVKAEDDDEAAEP